MELPELPEKSIRKFTDEEIAEIKDQLLESIYVDIGKSVVRKFLWVFGTSVLMLYSVVSNKQKIVEWLLSK